MHQIKTYFYTFVLTCIFCSCEIEKSGSKPIESVNDLPNNISIRITNVDSLKEKINQLNSNFYFIKHGDISIQKMKTMKYEPESIQQDQIGELLFNSVIIDSIKKEHYSIKLFKSKTGSSVSEFEYENQSDEIYIVGQSNLGEPVMYFIKRIGPFYGSLNLTSKIENKNFLLDIEVNNEIFSRKIPFVVDLEKEFDQF